jgi:hypothetical protein
VERYLQNKGDYRLALELHIHRTYLNHHASSHQRIAHNNSELVRGQLRPKLLSPPLVRSSPSLRFATHNHPETLRPTATDGMVLLGPEQKMHRSDGPGARPQELLRGSASY